MSQLPPLSKGKANPKSAKNKAGAKVNWEGPSGKGKGVPTGGLENRSTAKAAGSKNIRKTGGSSSKGS